MMSFSRIKMIGIGSAGALIFSLYIIYDTQLMVCELVHTIKSMVERNAINFSLGRFVLTFNSFYAFFLFRWEVDTSTPFHQRNMYLHH